MDSVVCKICFKCGIKKLLDYFYFQKRMSDGYLNKCKECTKQDVRENYSDNFDHYKDYEEARFATPERKAYVTIKQREHRAKNPEKYKARTAVSNAVRDKRLFKKPCEECDNEIAQAHHEDYSKQLEVKWLCFECHRKEHNQLKYLD